MYYSSGTTTYAANTMGIGDAVFLYDSTNNTYWRTDTNRESGISYQMNITSGHNFFGLYDEFSFGNLSDYNFRNASGGNVTTQGYEFQINYYNSYNNSNQQWVSHIYSWSFNNATQLGTYENGLDALHVYSEYNVTINISAPQTGYVTGNWT